MLKSSESGNFDIEQIRHRRADAESRTLQERRVAEYERKHKIEALFGDLAAELATRQPATKADCERFLSQYLARLSYEKDRMLQSLRFTSTCEIQFGPEKTVTLHVEPIPAMLVISFGAVKDKVPVERLEDLARIQLYIEQLSPHATILTSENKHRAFTLVLDTIHQRAVLKDKETESIAGEIMNTALAIRQHAHRCGTFVPM